MEQIPTVIWIPNHLRSSVSFMDTTYTITDRRTDRPCYWIYSNDFKSPLLHEKTISVYNRNYSAMQTVHHNIKIVCSIPFLNAIFFPHEW